MRETQETIGQWADQTFGAGDSHSPARPLRLLEEVVELCRAAGATAQEIYEKVEQVNFASHNKGKFKDESGVPEELADCAIVLYTICHARGVDLRKEVNAKMKTNRDRVWQCNGDGTGHHKDTLGLDQ